MYFLNIFLFRATTHTDLILRAVEKNIPYSVVHNASIMNAIGCCGLQVIFMMINLITPVISYPY